MRDEQKDRALLAALAKHKGPTTVKQLAADLHWNNTTVKCRLNALWLMDRVEWRGINTQNASTWESKKRENP